MNKLLERVGKLLAAVARTSRGHVEIVSARAQRSNKIGKKRLKKPRKRVFPCLLEKVGGAFPTIPQPTLCKK
jgi:hypothetical protein